MARVLYPLNRRDFVRTASAGIAGVAVLGSEGLAAIAAPPKRRVALVHTTDRKKGVAAAIKLFDPRGIAGKRRPADVMADIRANMYEPVYRPYV